MLEISLNVYYTIALAIVVLMVGDFIKKHVYVLRTVTRSVADPDIGLFVKRDAAVCL